MRKLTENAKQLKIIQQIHTTSINPLEIRQIPALDSKVTLMLLQRPHEVLAQGSQNELKLIKVRTNFLECHTQYKNRCRNIPNKSNAVQHLKHPQKMNRDPSKIRSNSNSARQMCFGNPMTPQGAPKVLELFTQGANMES